MHNCALVALWMLVSMQDLASLYMYSVLVSMQDLTSLYMYSVLSLNC